VRTVGRKIARTLSATSNRDEEAFTTMLSPRVFLTPERPDSGSLAESRDLLISDGSCPLVSIRVGW
jgi:hypothetical protein